jgi:hypothetical protein
MMRILPALWKTVRYVEGNAQRAGLVRRAEDWPWCSAHARLHGNEKERKILSPYPWQNLAGAGSG